MKGLVFVCVVWGGVVGSRAELAIEAQFPAQAGTLVGIGFDKGNDEIWAYGAFGESLRRYSRAGVFNVVANRGGEAANDADIDFAPTAFVLGEQAIAEGSVLFINGETGGADIYAMDKSTGAALGTLQTSFGANHVVGGAFHPTRQTLFLVADKLDDVNPSTIAEVNPRTGVVISKFGTGSADFSVNYGDLAIDGRTGNLLLVSSDELSIRELKPDGTVIRDLALPTGVSGLSGIGLDEARNQAVVSGTDGNIWILRGLIGELRLTIRLRSQNEAEICWIARADKRYNLQRLEQFGTGATWTNYKTDLPGEEPTACVIEPGFAQTSTRFYRVQELP